MPCPFHVWRGNGGGEIFYLPSNRKGRLKTGKPSFRRPFDFVGTMLIMRILGTDDFGCGIF
ncbi:hypothetical protein NEIMUCOT_04480 [Neisseria mucosa ATCC 25996]|uniref:Uncharacterized protein n=1 Tax=Neisseria mucosa (strain ATCC 25996 / DSM 4631 / NCTC 10774 / M26) TaxID=546266 RepID=D2ZV39_NEIM2|nr:hypothetical protein NEIMUCOT_04480 [Neisseria mucosa ATCC 25996]